MDSSDVGFSGEDSFKVMEEHFMVSLEAGAGNLPTLQPDWDLVEPRMHSASIPSHLDSSEIDSPRTAVMIHAYYEEGLNALLSRMRQIVWPASFFFTTDTIDKARRIRELAIDSLGSGASFEIRLIPNRGRDVLAFWISLQEDVADYDIFLKLHLKRSAHIEPWAAVGNGAITGLEWFEDILSCLIPSSPASFRAMQSLIVPGRLAALYPRPWGPLAKYGWGVPANLHWVEEILWAQGVHGVNVLLPLIYPVGNMFMGSVSSFLPLAGFFLKLVENTSEPLPIDGTVLHGIERCYSYLLAAQGQNAGVLFPSRPSELSGDVRWWSFPTSEHFMHVNSSADAFSRHPIASMYAKLGIIAMERHCQHIREITRLEGQNRVLKEQIQILSRSPFRRLLARFAGG
jgi:hypothetical protein